MKGPVPHKFRQSLILPYCLMISGGYMKVPLPHAVNINPWYTGFTLTSRVYLSVALIDVGFCCAGIVYLSDLAASKNTRFKLKTASSALKSRPFTSLLP